MLVRFLIVSAAIYLVLCLIVFIFQRQILYYPTKLPVAEALSLAVENGFSPWRNRDGTIIGWMMPATTKTKGSVLIAHGNAGYALHREYIARPIHEAAAVDVYVLEYPGYGARAGDPTKASLTEAAEEGFRTLPLGLPKYLVSESIGTGIVAELARSHPREVRGIAMLAPYHDLAWVAQHKIWIVPGYPLLRDRFNPEDCLRSYHGPVQFLVAGADQVIGTETGQRLAAGYAGPKRVCIVARAGHNDVAEQSAQWWREVIEFWEDKRP